MVDHVRILEDLVVEAVDRLRGLKELTRDRDRLGKEVGKLRERVDELEREASRSGRGSDAERVWQGRQEQARSILNEALVELQGE